MGDCPKSKQGTKTALWGSAGTPPPVCLGHNRGLGGGLYASPSQQCAPIPAGPTGMDGRTRCSTMLAPSRLEVLSISFLPAGNVGTGTHSWLMAPIPGTAGGPGCDRAWCALQLWERDGKAQEGKRREKKRALVQHNPGPCCTTRCRQEEGGSHEPPIRAPQQEAVIVSMGKPRHGAAGTPVAQAVTGLSATLSPQPWVELVPLRPPAGMGSVPGGDRKPHGKGKCHPCFLPCHPWELHLHSLPVPGESFGLSAPGPCPHSCDGCPTSPYSPMAPDSLSSPCARLCLQPSPPLAVPRPVLSPLGACPARQQRKGLSE